METFGFSKEDVVLRILSHLGAYYLGCTQEESLIAIMNKHQEQLKKMLIQAGKLGVEIRKIARYDDYGIEIFKGEKSLGTM